MAPPLFVPVPYRVAFTGRQLKLPFSSSVALVPTWIAPGPIAFVLELSCTPPWSTNSPPVNALLAESTTVPAPVLRNACAPEIWAAAVKGADESFVQVCGPDSSTRHARICDPAESA